MFNEVAGAIKEGLKVYAQWQKSREKRRYKNCIEAGEQYIFHNEDADLEDKERNKLLKKDKRRFFKYNQG